MKFLEGAIYRAVQHARYTSARNAKQKKPTMIAQHRKLHTIIHSANVEVSSVPRRTRNTGIVGGI